MITVSFFFFFFNDTATTEIYTLSLHDALPISGEMARLVSKSITEILRHSIDVARSFAVDRQVILVLKGSPTLVAAPDGDRKSTRLNSSHLVISYAVFCLKKKNNTLSNYYNIQQ